MSPLRKGSNPPLSYLPASRNGVHETNDKGYCPRVGSNCSGGCALDGAGRHFGHPGERAPKHRGGELAPRPGHGPRRRRRQTPVRSEPRPEHGPRRRRGVSERRCPGGTGTEERAASRAADRRRWRVDAIGNARGGALRSGQRPRDGAGGRACAGGANAKGSGGSCMPVTAVDGSCPPSPHGEALCTASCGVGAAAGRAATGFPDLVLPVRGRAAGARLRIWEQRSAGPPGPVVSTSEGMRDVESAPPSPCHAVGWRSAGSGVADVRGRDVRSPVLSCGCP